MAILKTASFSCAIVCMAIVSAMNWNRIILQIPEHQLCHLRHRQGKWGSQRLPHPLIHLLSRGQRSDHDSCSSGELQPAIISRGNKTGAAMYAAYKLPLLKSKVYINYFPSLIINNNWCCLCTSCRWWRVTINGKQNKEKDRFYVSPHPRFSGAELSPVKVWNQHISLLPTHYLITTKMWLLLSHSWSRQWQKKVAVQCKSSSEKKSQQAISC